MMKSISVVFVWCAILAFIVIGACFSCDAKATVVDIFNVEFESAPNLFLQGSQSADNFSFEWQYLNQPIQEVNGLGLSTLTIDYEIVYGVPTERDYLLTGKYIANGSGMDFSGYRFTITDGRAFFVDPNILIADGISDCNYVITNFGKTIVLLSAYPRGF